MELQEQEDNKTAKIFGMVRSRKELVINGIVFMLINAGYHIFSFISQLPYGYKDNPELLNDIEFEAPPMVLTVFLYLFAYILIDRGLFGSDVLKMVDKYGTTGYFLRKIALMLSVIFVSLLLEVIILFFIL